MMINNTTSIDDLLKEAIFMVNALNTGEEFMVKDLFRGFEWSRIPRNTRSRLGIMFFNYSQAQGNGLVSALGKTSQNQQLYRKI